MHFLNEEGRREGLIPDRRKQRSGAQGRVGRAKARVCKEVYRRGMQGLDVGLAIQGRLVGRGRGNYLQGRRPAPLPTMHCSLSSSSCCRSGCGGWGALRVVRRGVVGGAVHPGSCSPKATRGREEIGRGRPSSIPSLAQKPGQLRIILCPFSALPNASCSWDAEFLAKVAAHY